MLKTGKIETSIHLITIGWVHIKQRGRERWCMSMAEEREQNSEGGTSE